MDFYNKIQELESILYNLNIDSSLKANYKNLKILNSDIYRYEIDNFYIFTYKNQDIKNLFYFNYINFLISEIKYIKNEMDQITYNIDNLKIKILLEKFLLLLQPEFYDSNIQKIKNEQFSDIYQGIFNIDKEKKYSRYKYPQLNDILNNDTKYIILRKYNNLTENNSKELKEKLKNLNILNKILIFNNLTLEDIKLIDNEPIIYNLIKIIPLFNYYSYQSPIFPNYIKFIEIFNQFELRDFNDKKIYLNLEKLIENKPIYSIQGATPIDNAFLNFYKGSYIQNIEKQYNFFLNNSNFLVQE